MRWIASGSAITLLLIGTGLWLAREPIADSFIASELADRGVQGRYEITRIGPRRQRLANLVIGDPKRPDLVVKFLELDLGWGLSGPYIERLQASGVRLRGKLDGGSLQLGQVGRLLEGGEGKPELPIWTAVIEDAEAEIASEYGTFVFGLDGRGPLQSGFSGRLNVAAQSLDAGHCRIGRIRAPLDVATEQGRLVLKGPAAARSLLCDDIDLQLDGPGLDINVRTDLAMEEVGGAITLQANQLLQAKTQLKYLSGLLTFSGRGDDLRGSVSVAADTASSSGVQSDAVKLGGNFALRLAARDRAFAWQGAATVENARPARGVDMAALTSSMAGTPVSPLAAKFARAVQAIGKSNRIEVGGQLNILGSNGNARLDRLALTSASGAQIENWEGTVVRLDWPGKLRASGRVDVRGGGLPEGRIDFATSPDGGVQGTATFRPYQAEDARLALTPLRFAVDGRGRTKLETVATLDGPLPEGGVRGLKVPVSAAVGANGTISLLGNCAPLSWTSFAMSGLSLSPAQLQVCGLSSGAPHVRDVALNGRLGDSPITLRADSADYQLSSGRFALAEPDVRIGQDESALRLAATRLAGGMTEVGFAGKLENGRGRIGTVPLDLSRINGDWSYARSRLTVEGSLRVEDTQADRRFNPLAAEQVRLTLENGRIDTVGVLIHPDRRAQVAAVNIRHNLSTGSGQADLVVDNLRFGDRIQPDDLTPLVLGVVANVEGPVEGKGQIRWNGDQVTSDGVFSTKDLAFAAAFGPVSGFSTTVRFADLLGLRTEAGQVATIDSVNPGIEVRDGTIRYALRSSEEAVIEGGRWPFSGGVLELMPAPLALDSRQPRNLTFRVVGLEAGAFINTLELDNISATGVFDGLLPMVFDHNGGRIVGGLLVARQAGDEPRYLTTTQGLTIPCDASRQAGHLSYVGEVSNAQLNAVSRLAFDALKNLGYRCLAIRLDGAIDGEFVTQVSINGVNQGTEEARRSFISRPFLGLPFIFNVRIEAPFRGLLNTATGLADPTKLISGSLGDQFEPVQRGNGGLAVQPSDSEKAAKGDSK
jgi:translocation and assembly module TamB